MAGSRGNAIDWVAENLEYWAGVRGESAASLRGRMNTIAFALRALSVAAPAPDEAATAGIDPAPEPDDLDAYVREQAAQDPQFASAYVQAQHEAQIRAYQDLLASIELHINWPHVTKQLPTEQKNLLADAVDASSARLAEADPAYGAPVKVERWWDV